jgi:hypothetical protein
MEPIFELLEADSADAVVSC